ncbi:hypothetical protein ABEB36_005656 [Hypothenemus hampei]|uniref:Ionotropic receptor n=1 Tax=Hypothenemus hampei TaxID=57062 RepID=A0ABD1EZ03_HYPHA
MSHWSKMRVISLFLIECTVLAIGTSEMNVDSQMNFIFDVVKERKPHNVILMQLCWSKDKVIELERKLLTNNFKYQFIKNAKSIPYKTHHYTIVGDTECNFHLLYEYAVENFLLPYPNLWIVFGNATNLKETNYFIPINSLWIMPTAFGVKTLYKINKKLQDYEETISGKVSDIDIIHNRIDFKKHPIRVTYVMNNNETFEHFKDYRNTTVNNFSKIVYLLYQHIFLFLNATEIQVFQDTWGFETKDKNRVFAPGLFNDLHSDRSDIAGSVAFTPPNRLKYFTFIFAPIRGASITMVFRAPPLAYNKNIFLLPFDQFVWISIGVIFLFYNFMLNIVYSVERKREKSENGNKVGFFDIVMLQLAITCQMDVDWMPKSLSGKLSVFFLLIFYTFLYTAFSAKILLLLQSNTNAITDIAGLYKAGFDFAIENQPYNIYYVTVPTSRSNEYWRKKIYENKILTPQGPRFINALTGIQLVRDTYLAFHVASLTVFPEMEKTYTTTQACSVRLVDSFFKSDIPHIALPKNSSYSKFFLLSYRRLEEIGIHSREHQRCFKQKLHCSGRTNTVVSVGFREVYFPFFIYIAGFLLSVCIFAMEHLIKMSSKYPINCCKKN